MEAMFANIRKQLNEINNKPISAEQKNIEAKEVALKEWKMIIHEVPLGGVDKEDLSYIPVMKTKHIFLIF